MDSSLKISGLRQSLFCIFWCHLLYEHQTAFVLYAAGLCVFGGVSATVCVCMSGCTFQCVLQLFCVQSTFVCFHRGTPVHRESRQSQNAPPINTVGLTSWNRLVFNHSLSQTGVKKSACLCNFCLHDCCEYIFPQVISDENPWQRLCPAQCHRTGEREWNCVHKVIKQCWNCVVIFVDNLKREQMGSGF